ncbi:hypothetical protein AB4383_16095 [Vibrio breoganii]
MLMFTLISCLRYVIHPALTTYLGGYDGRSHLEPLAETYIEAVYVMIYEFICVAVIILIYEYKGRKTDFISGLLKPTLGVKYAIVFFIFCFVIVLINPSALIQINFVFPTAITDGTIIDSSTMLYSYLFILAKNILCINVLYALSLKYNEGKNKKYLLFAMLVTFISILIYSGTNRTDILINAIVLMFFLYKLFGRVALKTSLILVILMPIIFSIITQHRQYVTRDQTSLELKNDYMQTYFGGVYNVAIGLEIENNYPEASHYSVMLFDIFRPMIGVGLFIKNMDIKYSNIYFNDRMWRHVDRRSQIMPMVAQGNLYFGFIGAPIFTVLFVMLALKLIKFINGNLGLELKFFLSLVTARMGMVFGQNTMNLINDLSMNLFIVILLFALVAFISRISTNEKSDANT